MHFLMYEWAVSIGLLIAIGFNSFNGNNSTFIGEKLLLEKNKSGN